MHSSASFGNSIGAAATLSSSSTSATVDDPPPSLPRVDYNYKGVCGILTHYYYRDGKYLDITAFLVREGPSMGHQAGYFTAPMGVLDESSISKGVAREVHEEMYVDIDPHTFRDPETFRLVRVPFPGHDFDIRHNAVFISKEPLNDVATYGRRRYHEKKKEYEQEYNRLLKKNYSVSSIAPFLETDDLAHVPLRNLLAAVPLNNKGSPSLYPDGFLPLKGHLVGPYKTTDIDNEGIELRSVFCHILSHPMVRAELQRQIDTFDQRFGNAGSTHGTMSTSTSPAPLSSLSTNTTLSSSSISSSLSTTKNYKGVCGILTNHYYRNGKYEDITAFLIREGPGMGSQAGYYTAPMGILDEYSVSKGVAREVHEELHVNIDSRKFRSPDLFRMVRVPIVRPDNGIAPDAVFISKEPMEEVIYFSRSRFRQLKEGYENDYERLCQNNEDTSSIEPFLETDGMTHVPVRNLLAAVPLNNLADSSQYPDQFLPLGKGDFLKYTVKDIDNNDIPLRPIFAHILSHPMVRDELQRQVNEFDQQRYGTASLTASTKDAVVSTPSSSSSSSSVVPSSIHYPSKSSLDSLTRSSALSIGSLAHKTALQPLQKKMNGEKSLMTLLPLPYQDPHANMHLVAEVHISEEQPPFRLYVGDLDAANNWEQLSSAGITHIVNCCIADQGTNDKGSWTPFIHHGIQYGIVNTNDSRSNGSIHLEDPSGQWPAVMALLREAMHYPGGGAALVHCYIGKNRSVTTAAVFMALHGLANSFDDAVYHIKSIRAAAGPMPVYLRFGEQFVNRASNLPPYKIVPPSSKAGPIEKKSKADTTMSTYQTPVNGKNILHSSALRKQWLKSTETDSDEDDDNV